MQLFACCASSGGHSWSTFIYLFTAYTTSPVLIGSPEAARRRATGCAVYQLTSAYRTKEQLGCWWGSASLPREFPFLLLLFKTSCTAAGRQETYNCVSSRKGTTALLEVPAELSRATGRTGKLFTRSWQLKLSTPDAILLLLSPLFRSGGRRWVSTISAGKRRKKMHLWRVATVPNCTRGVCEKDASARSAHRCLQVWTKAHRWKFTCFCSLELHAGQWAAHGLSPTPNNIKKRQKRWLLFVNGA